MGTMFGKGLLTLSAAGAILGPFIADFNETHVLNPRWPPHAKFHNGQTMSMGLGLGLATLFYTWRTGTLKSTEMVKDSLFTAAIFGSIYWVKCYPVSWDVGRRPGIWGGISAVLVVRRIGF